jgi:hypothetical protein
MGDLIRTVRAALSDALAVLLPESCAGCGAGDTGLCEECATALSPKCEQTRLEGEVQVVSGLRFEGAVARIVRS